MKLPQILRILEEDYEGIELTLAAMQDAYLPQRLEDKLLYICNYIEMARVVGVPMRYPSIFQMLRVLRGV